MEELLRLPEIPDPAPLITAHTMVELDKLDIGSHTRFGRHLKSSLWNISPEWTFLNHAAFGM
jgi:hypothetical protein